MQHSHIGKIGSWLLNLQRHKIKTVEATSVFRDPSIDSLVEAKNSRIIIRIIVNSISYSVSSTRRFIEHYTLIKWNRHRLVFWDELRYSKMRSSPSWLVPWAVFAIGYNHGVLMIALSLHSNWAILDFMNFKIKS